MTNSQLSTVLNICIRLLDAADDLGVDVTSIVKGKIDSEFNDKMFEVCGFGRENQRLPVLTQSEIDTGRFNGKLDAVKAYKTRTGQSLMDSKHAVEQWFENNGLAFHKY